MREHAYLSAMVGFVRNHVAQHFRANRPRASPAVPEKFPDAAFATIERLGEHLLAARGALGQSSAGRPRRAGRPMELAWNFQVRSCEPDPLAAHVVHMREDRSNRPSLSEGLGLPCERVKMLDEHVVHAIVDGENLRCGLAEWSVHFVLTRGHGNLLLAL